MRRCLLLVIAVCCAMPLPARAAGKGFWRNLFNGSASDPFARSARSEPDSSARSTFMSGSHSEPEPFERATLMANIARGEEKVVSFDRAGGAATPSDASSRYVVIRDAFGGKKHVLGILTPHGRRQAKTIFDGAALSPREVGAVFRAVLFADVSATGKTQSSWRARVNLPARVAVDIMHVHGDSGPRRGSALGTPTSRLAGFDLYEGKRLAASAPISSSHLGAGDEERLGRMVLAVAEAAKARGIRGGSIEVSRTDSQLTVRLQTGGHFAFGSDE